MKIKLPKDWYIWVSVIAIIAVIILIGPELRIKVLKVLLIVLFLGGMLALAIVPKIIAVSQKHWASKPPNARQKQEAKEWDAFIARVKASPAANKPSSPASRGWTSPADAQRMQSTAGKAVSAADGMLPPEFALLLTSQLAAMWLDTQEDKYRSEYLRRMRMCGLSDKAGEEMLAFETDILRQYPRPELLRKDFIHASMFSLVHPFLKEPLKYYETNLVFPFSYIVKLSDEAEWLVWNRRSDIRLFDPIWLEIRGLSDQQRLLFLPFATHLVDHMGWTYENVNRFSFNEQGMLDRYRWGKTSSAASTTPWGYHEPARSPGKDGRGTWLVGSETAEEEPFPDEKQAEKAEQADEISPGDKEDLPEQDAGKNNVNAPAPTPSPAQPAAAVSPAAGKEPKREAEQRFEFPDADGPIRKMVHKEFQGWQQYDFLLTEGFGWQTIVNWAQDAADGDLKPIQTLTCALTPGSADNEFIGQYRANGGRIANIPDIYEEEWSSLSVGGMSRELHTLVKLVWFNQTQVLRLFTPRDDNDRVLRYAKALIGREQERRRRENQHFATGNEPPEAEASVRSPGKPDGAPTGRAAVSEYAETSAAGLSAMYPGGTPFIWNGETVMRIFLHGENEKAVWASIEHPFSLAHSPAPKRSAEMLYSYLSRCNLLKDVLHVILGFRDHHIEYQGAYSTGHESRDELEFVYYEKTSPHEGEDVYHQSWRMLPLSDQERESLHIPEKIMTGLDDCYCPDTHIPLPPCDGYWKADDMLYLVNPFAMQDIFKLRAVE